MHETSNYSWLPISGTSKGPATPHFLEVAMQFWPFSISFKALSLSIRLVELKRLLTPRTDAILFYMCSFWKSNVLFWFKLFEFENFKSLFTRNVFLKTTLFHLWEVICPMELKKTVPLKESSIYRGFFKQIQGTSENRSI